MYMKRNILMLFCMLLCGMLCGQTPAVTNIGRNKYPAILPDSRIEFQVKAPEAMKVQIDFGRKYDMTKNADGVWRVITEPCGPGIHYYSLVIDGVAVADPASESFYGCGRMMSCVEVPYPDGGKQYEVSDVPHGDVRTKYYYSTTTNSWRKMYIYAPAGYDINTDEKYPVLYIMHGGGEDARGWIQQGRTDIIMDNLIAGNKAEPMLVVSFDANVGGYDGIEKEIMENVVPFIESNYRVYTTPDKRALAGLSMGGIFTLYAGIPRTDIFNYLGVFSSGWIASGAPFMGSGSEAENSYAYLKANKEKVNNNLKLFWIAMGGKEDIAYNNCNIMMKRFDEIGIKYTYYESAGGGHTWPVWREDLYLFAPQLFK